MMDSVTRFAMAQREVGLTIGEPPATRGYPPSVFALLPKLLERSGAGVKGTITGMYTVLVDGDDINEPITDTVRSILDGHIMLSRNLASKNHYPAIDVLNSVSRVMIDIVDRAHLNAGQEMRNMLAAYREAEDLINIGAYATGSNPRIDRAIRKIAQLEAFLQQDINASVPFDDTKQRLLALMSE
jgi:flagellum-specific ATP synthase